MSSYNMMVGIGVILVTKKTMRIEVLRARADAVGGRERAAVNHA